MWPPYEGEKTYWVVFNSRQGQEDLTATQQSEIDRLCSASSNRETQLVSFFNKEKFVAILDLLVYMKTKCGGVCPPGEYVQHYLIQSFKLGLSFRCLPACSRCLLPLNNCCLLAWTLLIAPLLLLHLC
jgi:hypothetical protein